jgi:hypothetical protein
VAERRRRSPAPATEEAPASGCPVPLCPICTVATVLGEARPEVAEHLLAATREALLALRAVVDARLESTEHGEGRGRVQRVDIA